MRKQRAAAPLQPRRNGYDARPKCHDRSQPPAAPLASAAPPAPWWVPRHCACILAHTNTKTSRFPGMQAPALRGARAPTRCRAGQFPHICPRATGRHPCSRSRARTTARTDLPPQARVGAGSVAGASVGSAAPAVARIPHKCEGTASARGQRNQPLNQHHRRHNTPTAASARQFTIPMAGVLPATRAVATASVTVADSRDGGAWRRTLVPNPPQGPPWHPLTAQGRRLHQCAVSSLALSV